MNLMKFPVYISFFVWNCADCLVDSWFQYLAYSLILFLILSSFTLQHIASLSQLPPLSLPFPFILFVGHSQVSYCCGQLGILLPLHLHLLFQRIDFILIVVIAPTNHWVFLSDFTFEFIDEMIEVTELLVHVGVVLT